MAEQKPVQFHLPENKPSKTIKPKKMTPESYMSKAQPFSFSAPMGFEAPLWGKVWEVMRRLRDEEAGRTFEWREGDLWENSLCENFSCAESC